MFKLMGKKIFTILRLIFFVYLNLWRERGEEKEREGGRDRGNVQLYKIVHLEI